MTFNFDAITNSVWVGTALINTDHCQQVIDAGVDSILCLQSDDDLQTLSIDLPTLVDYCQQRQVLHQRVAIIDFDHNDLLQKLPQAITTLSKLLAQDRRVYLHCNAGQQRSPNCLIGYLAWVKQIGLAKAFDLVTNQRQCEPDLAQLQQLDAMVQRTELRF